LETLKLSEDAVAKALQEVCAGRSASIEHVTLSEEVILGEGLESTVTVDRRMN
jgi:hypothetical protein